MSKLVLLVLVIASGFSPAYAQTEEDRLAIREAALDYIEGWYTGDAERMERAVHPELAKRIVQTYDGESRLGHQDAAILVGNTRRGGGGDTPESRRLKEVTILDIYENAASVRVDASDWIDYLHLTKWNGSWKIINVLWELNPQQGTTRQWQFAARADEPLTLVETPLPEPGPRQVLLRVRATSLNARDLSMLGRPAGPEAIPLSDGAGTRRCTR